MNKEDRHKYNVLAKRGKFKFEFSCLDKERYDKELKGLVKFSKSLYKPKKCLSAYMIFVKEVSYIFSFTMQTRPKIVQANPDMGALIVMKYVGKAWKNLTKQERQYFDEKADIDKIRYLKETRAFYDEVQRIGTQHGTVQGKSGIINVV